jgi:hypothetical protein
MMVVTYKIVFQSFVYGCKLDEVLQIITLSLARQIIMFVVAYMATYFYLLINFRQDITFKFLNFMKFSSLTITTQFFNMQRCNSSQT